MTVLHLACLHGRGEVVRLLLHEKANVKIANSFGKTALEVAAGTVFWSELKPILQPYVTHREIRQAEQNANALKQPSKRR